MRRLIIRGLLIGAALLLLLFLLFRNRLPFGGNNSSFSCDPAHDITTIEFSAGKNKLTLVKRDASWLVNGKTEARKSAIVFIIRILREIEIKSPVSPDLFSSEISKKGIEPVKVKIYDGRKQLRSILVYKTGSNSYGNIMKLSESSKPFIVYVPGYDGEIGSAFTLNELFWKPYTVFNLLPSEIASVEFENHTDTSASFSIASVKHHIVLSSHGRELSGWDSTLVSRYLSYFAWIPFEKWDLEMTPEEKKSLLMSGPLYRITVVNQNGKKSVLTMWERNLDKGGAKVKDSDRLIGKTDADSEFFIMRYFDIDPLIKKRSYFFQ
jgi:hypothetical protein